MEFRHPRKIINPHPSQNRLNGTRVETANEMESFIMKKRYSVLLKGVVLTRFRELSIRGSYQLDLGTGTRHLITHISDASKRTVRKVNVKQ